MTIKRSKNINEVIYPFIYEKSPLCDYEVLTDELCSRLCMILANIDDDMVDLRSDLERIQEIIYHINGSIRGKLAVDETDLQWLHLRYNIYRQECEDRRIGFILPRGKHPIAALNLAKCNIKKVLRQLVIIDNAGIEIPAIISPMLNLLGNMFFILTLVINKRRNQLETPFISKSY